MQRRALRYTVAALIAVWLSAQWTMVSAHDIPTDVKVQAHLKPEGQRLTLLVRMPLGVMNDIEWPEEPRTGYLDLAKAESVLPLVAQGWILNNLAVYEDGVRLESPRLLDVRISLPSAPWFGSYEEALTQVSAARLPPETLLVRAQGVLDVRIEYAITAESSRFAIAPRFDGVGLRTTTVLRFVPPGSGERMFEFHDDPGVVELDPRWLQAAVRFVGSGFEHILGGIDHLLFLLCLVIPFRRIGTLVPIVTSFTVAHSITLIASAYGVAPDALWFPPLVETVIAGSIVYMAIENILAPQLGRRWLITFVFGLIHGFGFSFALRETLQFAGSHLVTSLLAFNVGVELGQLLVLVLIVPLLNLAFRAGIPERAGAIVLSAFVAHTGWEWMLERGGQLAMYEIRWPRASEDAVNGLFEFTLVFAIAAFAGWLISLWQRGNRTPNTIARAEVETS